MTSGSLFRFQRVYVEITNLCNLRCDFCAGTSRPPASMDADFFRTVLQQVAPLTGQISLHVLGEPLLHPQFPRIMDLCAEAPTAVNLTTNGTLLARHPFLLLAPALRQVNFSLQSLRRDRGFDEDTLAAVLDFTRQALARRPELYVNLRLWTLDSLQSPSESSFNSAMLARIAAALNLPPLELPQGRKSLRLAGRVYLHTDTVFHWPGSVDVQERDRGFCHALSTHCAILADGTVCPCCLDADGRLALGNLHDALLEDILDTPRAKAMAAGFAKGLLVEDACRHCDYCRRFKKGAKR